MGVINREKTKVKSIQNFATFNSSGTGETDQGANNGFEQKLKSCSVG